MLNSIWPLDCHIFYIHVFESKRISPLSLEFDPRWGLHSSHSCEKSKSTLCRKSWVFSGHSGFLPQGKLTGWVRTEISHWKTPHCMGNELNNSILFHTTIEQCWKMFMLGTDHILILSYSEFRRSNAQVILCHLCIALIGLLVSYFVVATREPRTNECLAFSLVTHYFLLATFAWMGVEGINMYLALVKVMSAHVPRFMPKAVLIAWGECDTRS